MAENDDVHVEGVHGECVHDVEVVAVRGDVNPHIREMVRGNHDAPLGDALLGDVPLDGVLLDDVHQILDHNFRHLFQLLNHRFHLHGLQILFLYPHSSVHLLPQGVFLQHQFLLQLYHHQNDAVVPCHENVLSYYACLLAIYGKMF